MQCPARHIGMGKVYPRRETPYVNYNWKQLLQTVLKIYLELVFAKRKREMESYLQTFLELYVHISGAYIFEIITGTHFCKQLRKYNFKYLVQAFLKL